MELTVHIYTLKKSSWLRSVTIASNESLWNVLRWNLPKRCIILIVKIISRKWFCSEVRLVHSLTKSIWLGGLKMYLEVADRHRSWNSNIDEESLNSPWKLRDNRFTSLSFFHLLCFPFNFSCILFFCFCHGPGFCWGCSIYFV